MAALVVHYVGLVTHRDYGLVEHGMSLIGDLMTRPVGLFEVIVIYFFITEMGYGMSLLTRFQV